MLLPTDFALRVITSYSIHYTKLYDTNGGSMPNEIAELTRNAAKTVDVPIGIHCHNDCELAIANSIAAVEAGLLRRFIAGHQARSRLRSPAPDAGRPSLPAFRPRGF